MRRGISVGFLVVACTSVLSWEFTLANTIDVPADQPTIQDAINSAVDGDEIVVAPGIYPEVIDLLRKAITVRSSEGPQVTIIDGTGLNDSVVTSKNGEEADTVREFLEDEGEVRRDGTGDPGNLWLFGLF